MYIKLEDKKVEDLELGKIYSDNELEELNNGLFSIQGTGGAEKGFDQNDWYLHHGDKWYMMKEQKDGKWKIIKEVSSEEVNNIHYKNK